MALPALRESETYLNTIMETVQAGILITEPETGNILDVNRFASKLVECPAEELIGRDSNDFMKTEKTKTLVIRGTVIMGGFEIRD